MDQGLSSSKPEHFDLRAIRQAAGGESLFPSSRLPLSCIRPVRISSKSGIHQEKVQAHRKVRYADRVGDKMAVRHKICADRLPVGERKGTVLPIHRHRRSIQKAIYLCLSGAFELFDDRFHQAFHYLLRLCSKGDPDRLRVRIHTYGKDEACTSF